MSQNTDGLPERSHRLALESSKQTAEPLRLINSAPRCQEGFRSSTPASGAMHALKPPASPAATQAGAVSAVTLLSLSLN